MRGISGKQFHADLQTTHCRNTILKLRDRREVYLYTKAVFSNCFRVTREWLVSPALG